MLRHRRARSASLRFIEALENRRLLSEGQLDTSFSGDGQATAQFKSDGFIDIGAIATTNDGKTIAVGTAGKGTDDIAMARFNFDGSLDATFGTSGTGVIQIHPDGDSGNLNVAQAVTIDGQGRIVVVGAAGDNFLALRFMPNGQLDKSFDHDGIVGIGFGFGESDQANAVAVQTDGKIVLAGEGGFGGNQIVMARLNSNGSLDTTFGDAVVANHTIVSHTGKETIDFGDTSDAEAVALDYTGGQTSPKIVVVGGFDSGSQSKAEVLRLNNNGSLDSSFDHDGKVSFSVPTHISANASGIVIQSSGKYVVTGSSSPNANSAFFFATRFNSNGSIDKTFGDQGDGIELISFGGSDFAESVTVGLNNRLFIAGSVGSEIAILALTKDGVRDTSFGNGGKVTSPTGGLVGIASTVGIAYLGDRLVVDGGSGSTMNVLRFLDIDPSVAVNAILTTASEQGPTPVTFIVSRDQRLPFDTDVLFSIGGTATAPSFFALKNGSADYTLSGLTIPQLVSIGHSATPFVDIPANQTFVLVTLTPVKDNTPEPTETATFNISANTSYSIDTPSSATINIQDNNISASTTLKTTADAYVRDGSDAGTNFGAATDLEVKKAGSGFNRVTYVKFDISSVSTIGSAKLQMFGGLSDTQDASITTSLFTVADTSWTETGIDFNNAPALSSSALVNAAITGTNGTTYTFDVTSYLQAQKAAGHNIVSFAFEDSATSNSFVKFNSKEAGNNPPTLAISASASASVGTFKISSPHSVANGQDTNVAVTWTVPSGSWRQLHTIDLQLRGDDGSLNQIEWDQENNTFALLDPDTGKFGAAKVLGSNNVLSNSRLSVLLKNSFTKANGPTSPVVMVTFDLRFKQAAAGHHFSVAVAASNDNGSQTMFGQGKSIAVA